MDAHETTPDPTNDRAGPTMNGFTNERWYWLSLNARRATRSFEARYRVAFWW